MIHGILVKTSHASFFPPLPLLLYYCFDFEPVKVRQIAWPTRHSSRHEHTVHRIDTQPTHPFFHYSPTERERRVQWRISFSFCLLWRRDVMKPTPPDKKNIYNSRISWTFSKKPLLPYYRFFVLCSTVAGTVPKNNENVRSGLAEKSLECRKERS